MGVINDNANQAEETRTAHLLSGAPDSIIRSDGEAFAAAAGALGVGIFEDEPGGEIVLTPIHYRSDQVHHRSAVDVKGAAGGLDLLVERLLLSDVVDRIGKPRAAAARCREFDPNRARGSARHQVRNARFGRGRQGDRRRTGAKLRFLVHSIPSSRRASSLIFDGSHGGSQTRLTTASRMPGTDRTRSSTSPGMDSATGQCGVVSVMVIVASPSSLISTS